MVVAYVDATYRPTDQKCGYGYAIERTQRDVSIPIRMGNKRLPFCNQGASEAELMAILDVCDICLTELMKPPDIGVARNIQSVRPQVLGLSRKSQRMRVVHQLAKMIR